MFTLIFSLPLEPRVLPDLMRLVKSLGQLTPPPKKKQLKFKLQFLL